MKIVLDTNRYVDFARDDRVVKSIIDSAEWVFLTFITIAELRTGFVGGTRRAENEQALSRFLSRPSTAILWPDDQTTKLFAELSVDMRRRGKPIPHHDSWIAALCLQHGLPLLTRDSHFQDIPSLELMRLPRT